MEGKQDLLDFDPVLACEQIMTFIRDKQTQLRRDGVLIGLSGGLDSAIVAYLAVRAVGKQNVTLLYMPERDSKDRHREDAAAIARALDASLQVQDIAPILQLIGVYDLLPLRYLPGQKLKEWVIRLGKSAAGTSQFLSQRLAPPPGSLVAKGNAYACVKHRLRMILLYYLAEIDNLMVVGAANKTELLTGTFSQWGCDQCADVMPLLHLYRSQLYPLARYLGVPEKTRTKPADPDVMPGIDDKEALLGSFLEVDQILWALDQRTPLDRVREQFGEGVVAHVLTLIQNAGHMRELPYVLCTDN